jgi:fido (protein-threonine AMPylation protein)
MATLFFPHGAEAKKFATRYKKGELNRIRKGIYIDSFNDGEISSTLENNWPQIAGYLFGAPLAVARTAAELKPAEGKLYFVSGELTGRRTVDVGHLCFNIAPGNVELGSQQFTFELKKSNRARYCLENMAASRGNKNSKKTLGAKWVENELIKVIRERGEKGLNELRDEAKELAALLDLAKEFHQLNQLVSAILNTHPATGVLQTETGLAQAKGEPFDPDRLDRFHAFAHYLTRLSLTKNNYIYSGSGWRNLSFFESYFSNYIEGTKFTIEEAEKIVFEKGIIYKRHADSHDVLAHMEITSDMAEMKRVPTTSHELISLLKIRHKLLLAERPEKRPGEFKDKANQAGTTQFVLPAEVEGTLVQGFKIYQQLPEGMHRALFIHFLVSECHPFDDGNGRISRIMMNAELVSQDQFKIIVPTVHRDSYLLGLKQATRSGRFRANVKVLHQLQCYIASIDWDDYGTVKEVLQKHAADKEPDEGVAVFNKVISRMGDEYLPG